MAEGGGSLGAASERLRETAKWFAVSVAALGAVAAAGLQLTGLGELPMGRLFIAAVGAACAVAGALTILWAVVQTLTGEVVSLSSLSVKAPAGAESVVGDETMLGGLADVAAVKKEYLEAVGARRSAYEEVWRDPADGGKVTRANLADTRFVAIDQVVGPLLEVVSYMHLAHSWRAARWRVLIGALLATLGLGIFAWAANPPEAAAASTASPNVVSTPDAGSMRLTAEGMAAVAESVGEGCWGDDATTVTLDVLVLDRTDAGPDVVVDQEGCEPVRVLLGPAWGSLTD